MTDGLFSGDAENVIRWVTGCGLALAAAAAGLITVVLVRKPEWRLSVPAKWTLFAGCFVLPSTTMLLGNVAGFHRVKQSCNECHTMDPWVSDMQDPKSTTLAAMHYKHRWINENQCYTCHTGYGLSGDVDAKISGLRHVMHYYVTGVPEEIRIRKPFPVSTCLHCHGSAAGYTSVEQHMDDEFRPKILSGEVSCFECHESAHPRRERGGGK